MAEWHIENHKPFGGPERVYRATVGTWEASCWYDERGRRWRWVSIHSNGENIAGSGWGFDLAHVQVLAVEAIQKRTA